MTRKKSPSKNVVSNNPKQSVPARNKPFFKPVLIVGILLLATVAFGAFTQWRNTTAGKTGTTSVNADGTISSVAVAPIATPVPPDYGANKPAREYVYGGGKLLAVSEPARVAPTDLAVWRISTGTWYVMNDGGTFTVQQWGLSNDLPAPGDYDGDGKTDFCVFRPSTGIWYVMQTGSNNAMATYAFGSSGDKPVPADFDGDGRTDLAVYRASNQTWYVYKIGSGVVAVQQFGSSGDVPVPSDYDGDGKADYAMWRSNTATWQIFESGSGNITSTQWGIGSDKPVPGDYDGDGKTDVAIWRNDNTWYIRQSSNNAWFTVGWGLQTDITVQGDYDADGKTDVAIWRPSTGTWYIRKSATGTMRAEQFGQNGDTPVPAPYRR
jgi:FG-GAP-like repeat